MRRSSERVLLAVLVLVAGTYAIAEEIILTTYYPSPRGVYDVLRSQQSYVRGGDGDFTGDGAVLATDWLGAIRCSTADWESPYDATNAPKCAATDLNGDGQVQPFEADLIARRAVGVIGNTDAMRKLARIANNTFMAPRIRQGLPYAMEVIAGADFYLLPFLGGYNPIPGPCDPNGATPCACTAGTEWSSATDFDGDRLIDNGECGLPPFKVIGTTGDATFGGTVNVNDVIVRTPGSSSSSIFKVTTVKSLVAAVSVLGSVATATCPPPLPGVPPKIRIGCLAQRTNAVGTQAGLLFNISAELTGAEPVGTLGCQGLAFNTNHVVYAFCMGP